MIERIDIMTFKLKRIREQQKLSPSFVATQLELSLEEYKDIESKSFNSLNSHLQSLLTTLFGVDFKDLDDSYKEKNNANEKVGLARIYKDLSSKDQKEINRFLNYKKLDIRSRLHEENFS